MNKDIVLLDGAYGTSLWAMAEARGIEKLPVWQYNMEHPELVRELAGEYIKAGSEIVQANTFGANAPAVMQSTGYVPEEVAAEGVRIVKEAACGTGAKVSLSVGPLSALLEPYGELSEAEAADIYSRQIGAGMSEKPDCIILETFMDLEMMKIAVKAAKKYDVPVFCMMTFQGRFTMMGNSVEAIVKGLEPLGIDAVGMNCSTGPVDALPVIREFSEKTQLPLVFKPNAGTPVLKADGSVEVPYNASVFADEIAPALDFVSYVGGCCGSDPGYIKELRQRIDREK